MKYMRPRLEDLYASKAEGLCVVGTGDASCEAGNAAASGCITGTSADACSGGSSAGTLCTTGDLYTP
jgi:hypothetical protein